MFASIIWVNLSPVVEKPFSQLLLPWLHVTRGYSYTLLGSLIMQPWQWILTWMWENASIQTIYSGQLMITTPPHMKIKWTVTKVTFSSDAAAARNIQHKQRTMFLRFVITRFIEENYYSYSQASWYNAPNGSPQLYIFYSTIPTLW